MRRLILVALLAVGACATPQTAPPVIEQAAVEQQAVALQYAAIADLRADAQRANDIYWRLVAANRDLCPRRTKSLGLSVQSLSQYGPKLRAAAKLAGIRDVPSIAIVIADSPAAKAGLRPGDRIMAVNGVRYPSTMAGVRAESAAIAAAPTGQALALSIKRGETEFPLETVAEEICDYPLLIIDEDILNASADGETIRLDRRMQHFTQSDGELGLILGHELAHNILGHTRAKQRNAMLGMLAGAVADTLINRSTGTYSEDLTNYGEQRGALAFSQAFESEADYVGMYSLARAGMPLDGVEGVWRRMALRAPEAVDYASTHPPDAQRFLAIAATRDEILAKRASNAPLAPNTRRQ